MNLVLNSDRILKIVISGRLKSELDLIKDNEFIESYLLIVF